MASAIDYRVSRVTVANRKAMKLILSAFLLALLTGLAVAGGRAIRLQSRYTGECVGTEFRESDPCNGVKTCPLSASEYISSVPCNDTRSVFRLWSDKTVRGSVKGNSNYSFCLTNYWWIEYHKPTQWYLGFQGCKLLDKKNIVFSLPKTNKTGPAMLKKADLCITAVDDERPDSKGYVSPFVFSPCSKKAGDNEFKRQQFKVISP